MMKYSDVHAIYNHNADEMKMWYAKLQTSGRKWLMCHDVGMLDQFGNTNPTIQYETNQNWVSNILHRQSHGSDKDFDLHLALLYRSQSYRTTYPMSKPLKYLICYANVFGINGYNCSLTVPIGRQVLDTHGWCNCVSEPHVTYAMGYTEEENFELMEKVVSTMHLKISVHVSNDGIQLSSPHGPVYGVKCSMNIPLFAAQQRRLLDSTYLNPFNLSYDLF